MIQKIFLSLLSLAILISLAYADDLSSPVGTWQTTSDKTKKPSSLVKITQEKDGLTGQVLQLLSGSSFKVTDLCTQCPDSFKNQPIIGLQFLWGFVPDENGGWKDGKVLDPNNGHIYRGTLKLIDNGKKMELRGYWGPFWRTQVWVRA